MGLQKGMIREERETGDAGIEPLGTRRGWTPGARGGPGLPEKPSWHISLVTSGKAQSREGQMHVD